MPEPVRTGVKLFGRRFIREYPYQDGYLLDDVRQIRAAVDLPMVLLGGITDRRIMDTAMHEGFQFVAMGRALLREPGLINRMAPTPIPACCATTTTGAWSRSSPAAPPWYPALRGV